MMLDQTLDCFVTSNANTKPVYTARPEDLDSVLAKLAPAQAAFLRDAGFNAKSGDLRLLPGEDGVAGAILGLGTSHAPFTFGVLPTQLPASSVWRLEPGDYDPAAAVLGYALGTYRYSRFRNETPEPARLFCPPGHEGSLSQAAAINMVRD